MGVKILVLLLGKTHKSYIEEGIKDYVNRLGYYLPFEVKVIPDLKKGNNLPVDAHKEKEGQLISGQMNGVPSFRL